MAIWAKTSGTSKKTLREEANLSQILHKPDSKQNNPGLCNRRRKHGLSANVLTDSHPGGTFHLESKKVFVVVNCFILRYHGLARLACSNE